MDNVFLRFDDNVLALVLTKYTGVSDWLRCACVSKKFKRAIYREWIWSGLAQRIGLMDLMEGCDIRAKVLETYDLDVAPRFIVTQKQFRLGTFNTTKVAVIGCCSEVNFESKQGKTALIERFVNNNFPPPSMSSKKYEKDFTVDSQNGKLIIHEIPDLDYEFASKQEIRAYFSNLTSLEVDATIIW